MAVSIGSPAPDFELVSSNATWGEKDAFGLSRVRLSDFKGKKNVVLLFFPGVFTPPCTQEMCGVSTSDYDQLDAVVIGISVDSALAQKIWIEKEGITVPLLSDYERKTVDAYGVTLDNFLGMGRGSKRAAIVVDKLGIIRYSEITPTPPEQPNFEAVKEVLKNIGRNDN